MLVLCVKNDDPKDYVIVHPGTPYEVKVFLLPKGKTSSRREGRLGFEAPKSSRIVRNLAVDKEPKA